MVDHPPLIERGEVFKLPLPLGERAGVRGRLEKPPHLSPLPKGERKYRGPMDFFTKIRKTIVCCGAVVLLGLFIAPTMAAALGRDGLEVVEPKLLEVKLDVPAKYKTGTFKKERTLKALPGFKVSVFASGLDGPRFMAVGPDGFIYVTLPRAGKVVVLPDRDHDNAADEITVFADGLDSPHGIAFRGTDMIIAETGGLVILRDTDGDLKADYKEVISRDIPSGGGHWTRTLVIGPDNRLYVSVGSSCNVCLEKDRRRAAVLRFPPGGGKASVYASGLRNSVGIAFHPLTGELWGVDNGRDWLGDDLPPEELNRITESGDFGWPFCYGQRVVDSDYGTTKRCAGTVPPMVEMQAHSAPLGLAFGHGGQGLNFPAPYKDVLYIAFHGSWNRSRLTGYKLIGIPFKDGRPSGEPFDFITGWLGWGGARGRPVAPVVGPDGALYLSDDKAGAVYRITAE
jgi:glucose/arabinose dehydrogenase